MSKETKTKSLGSTEKSDVILPNESITNLPTSMEKNVSLKTSPEMITTPTKTKVTPEKITTPTKTKVTPEKITTPIKSKITTPDKNMSPKIKNTPIKVNIPTETTTSKESSILTTTKKFKEMRIPEEINATLDKKSLPIENDCCDCGDVDCPGCFFFPCEVCGSHKCGHQCRNGRDWKNYDAWVIQGLEETDNDIVEIIEDEFKEINDLD